jgi:hypothetical protein
VLRYQGEETSRIEDSKHIHISRWYGPSPKQQSHRFFEKKMKEIGKLPGLQF